MAKILLIDDEQEWLESFARTFYSNSIADYSDIYLAANKSQALDILKKESINIIFLDLVIGSEHGEVVLQDIKREYADIPVIVMTGVNSLSMAVNCMKYGAADYFIKTMPVEELVSNIKRIIKLNELEKENFALKKGYLKPNSDISDVFKPFITNSSSMFDIFKYLEVVGKSRQPILITGESGVGKGLIAKAVAEIYGKDKPFVSVNVAGLDSQMFTDTLMGHVKGAFTGAEKNRNGLIHNAGSGTLFLDEIGDLSIQSQIKLLDLLQDGRYQSLGSDNFLKSEARFIFATNVDITDKVHKGEFRKDLYYRLNTHHIHIPPLRQRKSDIEPLINHFLSQEKNEYNKHDFNLSQESYQILKEMEYEGNARQLRSIIFDIVARGEKTFISTKSIDKKAVKTNAENIETLNINEINNNIIKKALILTKGNQVKAAALLGISQSKISRKIKKGEITLFD